MIGSQGRHETCSSKAGWVLHIFSGSILFEVTFWNNYLIVFDAWEATYVLPSLLCVASENRIYYL